MDTWKRNVKFVVKSFIKAIKNLLNSGQKETFVAENVLGKAWQSHWFNSFVNSVEKKFYGNQGQIIGIGSAVQYVEGKLVLVKQTKETGQEAKTQHGKAEKIKTCRVI